MKGFGSTDSYKQMYYMLEHPRFSQRTMSKDLGIKFGEKVNSFVRWLDDLKFVRKTNETRKGKPRYEVPSRMDLVRFYSRHRDMKSLILGRYEVNLDKKMTMKLLSENGGIMCLTTSLEMYGDEYFRDPLIHAYVDDRKILDALDSSTTGRTKIILYNFDLPDEIKEKDAIRYTSPNRTIIDLFCNNLSYAADDFIPKVWT